MQAHVSYKTIIRNNLGENRGFDFRGDFLLQGNVVVGRVDEEENALYLNSHLIFVHPLRGPINVKSGRIFHPESLRKCEGVGGSAGEGRPSEGNVQTEGVKTDTKAQHEVLRRCVVVATPDMKCAEFFGEAVSFRIMDSGDLKVGPYISSGREAHAVYAAGVWKIVNMGYTK